MLFARHEGIVPASEANHAVKGAIVEALRCKAEGRSQVILFNLCGHGHFDMSAYSAYFSGKLVDQQYDEAELEKWPRCLLCASRICSSSCSSSSVRREGPRPRAALSPLRDTDSNSHIIVAE